MPRGTRRELSTVGFDPDLQLVGSDPYGSPYALGQIIPPTPAVNGGRYLYILSYTSINAYAKQRLVGLRQLLTIGDYVQTGTGDAAQNYPLEMTIGSPYWRFVDGNVSWHLLRVPPGKQFPFNPLNAEGLQYRFGTTPTLLYETLSPYVAPYGGRPPGKPLPEVPDLANFHDLRFPYRSANAWLSLDVEIEGPCEVVFFASVRQTNADTRATYTIPTNLLGSPLIPAEDAFIATNGPAPNAVYKRIAGNMIFEKPNWISEPRELVEPREEMRPWLLQQ